MAKRGNVKNIYDAFFMVKKDAPTFEKEKADYLDLEMENMDLELDRLKQFDEIKYLEMLLEKALNDAFTAGRSKQTFNNFKKEWLSNHLSKFHITRKTPKQ